jgi:hypothetical protein
MRCLGVRHSAVLMLLGAALLLPHHHGYSQAKETQASPFSLRLPLSLEWNESFNPLTLNKLAVDGFKFQGGQKNFKMQYSMQAPAVLGGKQFAWMPGGYQTAAFSLFRKWGSIEGFQTVRYSARMVYPGYSRTITGTGVEAPKAIFGARMSAYFLHAAPTSEARQLQNPSITGSIGDQFGFTLARDFKNGAKVRAEWTESLHKPGLTTAQQTTGTFRGTRSAFMLGLDGSLAKTELSTALVLRDEGLANPAAPAYGPAKQNVRASARRKFKKHQLLFTIQSDDQKSALYRGSIDSSVREESAEWTYTNKRLPQIVAFQSLSRQTVAGRWEEEQGYRLSLTRSISRVNASLSLHRALRSDLSTQQPLWDRMVLSADTTIEVRKARRLHLRYETTGMTMNTISQQIMSSALQMDTRVAFWGDKFSLIPTMDFRRQTGTLQAYYLSTARMGLSAQIKVPRWFPGTDFLVNFALNHARVPGLPDWNHTDLTMRWNFKRL